MDPYESKAVVVLPSSVGEGEGLFARFDLKNKISFVQLFYTIMLFNILFLIVRKTYLVAR